MASNVIPFPTDRAKRSQEIQYLLEWREQIYSNFPKMNDLGVVLDCIERDLAELRRVA